MKTVSNIIFWAGTTLAAAFFGLLAVMSFSEWWQISMKKQAVSYPWGKVNSNPWYYGTPDLYSSVMLVEGILCAAAIIVLARQILKKNKEKILYTLLVCFGLFILMVINGLIK